MNRPAIALLLTACASPPPPVEPVAVAEPVEPSPPPEEAEDPPDLIRVVIHKDFLRMNNCGHDDAVGDLRCAFSVAGERNVHQPAQRLRIFLTEPPGVALIASDWDPAAKASGKTPVLADCEYDKRGVLSGVHFGAAAKITGYLYLDSIDVGVVSSCTFEPFDKMPERFAASHLLVSHDDAKRASKAKRTREEAAARAQTAADEVRTGGSFADAVTKYSDEPGATKRGGDLGSFRLDVMVPEFALVVASTPIGETSPAFESAYGFHVLKRRAPKR